jgi:hypothetical protein
MRFDISVFFDSLFREFKFAKNPSQIVGGYMKTSVLLLWYLAQLFLQWGMFQTFVVEKIKTYILCSVTFYRISCRLLENVEKCGTARQATDDNIIRRMRFACWITKATNTLGICNIYCFATVTVVTRTRLSVHGLRALPVLLCIM